MIVVAANKKEVVARQTLVKKKIEKLGARIKTIFN
jgi:hypothetical protein